MLSNGYSQAMDDNNNRLSDINRVITYADGEGNTCSPFIPTNKFKDLTTCVKMCEEECEPNCCFKGEDNQYYNKRVSHHKNNFTIIMVKQCTILFGCMALGELLVAVTGLSLPGSIVGMLLLAAFLEMGWVKLEWVKNISDFLLSNLGFFFVPPGVALMLNFDTIARDFWPITIATLVSTVLVLLSTGWTHQIVRRYGPFHK